MSNRYSNRKKYTNRLRMYSEQLSARNARLINQYSTPNMSYPNASQIRDLTTKTHVWAHGDRYYKLASDNYGDPTLWWLIAWFNQKPTEAHCKTGELVYVPLPLERVLSYLRSR